MRYAALDWGQKRIGVALSDAEGILGLPYGVWQFRNFESFLKDLALFIEKEGVGALIVGLPLSFAQKNTRQTEEVRRAGEKIKAALIIPVMFENEVLTTKLAARYQGEGQKNDASAAALILQSFLDRHTDATP